MDQNKCLVSVIIVNYRNYGFLRNCIASLKSADDKIMEIIVVDNESDRVAANDIKKEFEDIKLFALKDNLNYAEGSNFGVVHSQGDFVVILNNDTVVEKNWLKPLIEEGLKNSEALFQPKIVYLDKPDTVSSFGNAVHLFGFAFPIGIGKKVTEVMNGRGKLHRIFYCSGTCIFTSRKVLDRLGGFDSNYWTFYEDVNLGWKGNLFGFPSYLVPSSTVYHKWGLSHGQRLSSEKLFLLERGRLSTIFRNFSLRSILIILPFLVLLDAITLLYLLPRKDLLKAKVNASIEIVKNRKNIYQERKKLQRSRIKKDRDISSLFSTSIEHPHITMSSNAKKLLAFVSHRLQLMI